MNDQPEAGGPPPDETEAATGSAVAGATSAPEVVAVRQGAFGVSGSGDTSGFGGLVERVETPPSATRPFGGWFDEATDELELALADRGLPATEAVERIVIEHGEITYHVRREHLLQFAAALRNEPALRFEWCSGVSGVHYPQFSGKELHAVYHFTSITHGRSIRVEVSCPDDDPHIPSIVSLYPTNDWHERETYDFFGIVFDGHPALTRIMMPDDWVGHPQRKDYALNGVAVEYKGATVPPPDERRGYN
jgi:NADH-quinone oxidoreductase subunit C